MKRSASANAPGKVILLGEHSVVFGEPAIAAAIARRLTVTVRVEPGARPPADPRCAEALEGAARRFGLDPANLSMEVASDLSPACGLGSSAAISLALVRALADLTGAALSHDEVRLRAGEVENVFHGTASGVDVAASASDGLVWFERGRPPEPIPVKQSIALVVGLSGEERSTAGPVSRLRERAERRPDLYGSFFRLAGDLARSGRDALAAGDVEALGELMDAAQGLLNAFGVSTAALERMIWLARRAGALGAKLTGGGGGGAMIALAPGRAAAVSAALAGAGFETFVTPVTASPQAEAVHARSTRRSA